MTVRNFDLARSADRNTQWLLLFVVACRSAGPYTAVFGGLGRWALGVDEFYITRSVDQPAAHWRAPTSRCGGYYTRGTSATSTWSHRCAYSAYPLRLFGPAWSVLCGGLGGASSCPISSVAASEAACLVYWMLIILAGIGLGDRDGALREDVRTVSEYLPVGIWVYFPALHHRS